MKSHIRSIVQFQVSKKIELKTYLPSRKLCWPSGFNFFLSSTLVSRLSASSVLVITSKSDESPDSLRARLLAGATGVTNGGWTNWKSYKKTDFVNNRFIIHMYYHQVRQLQVQHLWSIIIIENVSSNEIRTREVLMRLKPVSHELQKFVVNVILYTKCLI